MNRSIWRDQAAPIIRKVIEENKGKTENEIRLALRGAYPFGQRKYHPYKIWLDEINRQLNPRPKHLGRKKKPEIVPKEQMSLFAKENR